MEKDLSSMLSTDPEDFYRLASVHSVSSCEEKPSYPFPWFLDLCDGSIGLMIPFYLFPRPVPGKYPDRHIFWHPRDCSLGSGSLGLWSFETSSICMGLPFFSSIIRIIMGTCPLNWYSAGSYFGMFFSVLTMVPPPWNGYFPHL